MNQRSNRSTDLNPQNRVPANEFYRRPTETSKMSKVIIIVFLAFYLVYDCSTRKLDVFDFQICAGFNFSGKYINGFHIQEVILSINFKEFEGQLRSIEYYKNFKDNFERYSDLGSVQKAILRSEISKALSANLGVNIDIRTIFVST